MKKKTLSEFGKFLLWNYTNDASTMSRSYWLQQLAFKRYRPLPPPPAPSPFTLPLHPPPDWCCLLFSPLFTYPSSPLYGPNWDTHKKNITHTHLKFKYVCVPYYWTYAIVRYLGDATRASVLLLLLARGVSFLMERTDRGEWKGETLKYDSLLDNLFLFRVGQHKMRQSSFEKINSLE